jgi:hypothetical protein
MNKLKLKKSVSIALGLLVAFFAHKWFEQAYAQPTDFGKWFMIIISLIVLIIILYFNLDNKGNF